MERVSHQSVQSPDPLYSILLFYMAILLVLRNAINIIYKIIANHLVLFLTTIGDCYERDTQKYSC